MAYIDHTTIVFKNGEWMKEPYTFDENDKYVNICPFEYGRDGNIHTVNGIDIRDGITWYRDEYDAVYERDGIERTYRLNMHVIVERIKWMLHFKRFVCYRKEVGIWCKDDTEIHIYHDELNQSYVSFYDNGTDTYIVIGGYGHWGNVYAHFMSRGYGDEFEEKMAQEAFQWACNNIVVDISESICGGSWELEEDFVNRMRERFGYEDPYRIVVGG